MLNRLFKSAPEARNIAATPWGSWGSDGGSMTHAGVAVTAESSLQLLTVYGCVRLITDQISTLPVDVYRKVGEAKEEVAAPRWLTQPTTNLGWSDWCSQVLTSLLLHGNAYVVVTRRDAAIVELVPLDPTLITVRREAGRKVFTVNGQVFPGEVLHLCGMMLPGSDVGLSPVEYARQSIGLGLATVEFGSKFFDGDGNMPGVIEIPGSAQPEQMKSMAEMWRRKRSRAGRGLPGVLEGGATWKPTGVTNEQAQFLATRGFTAAEIAGQMFLLDPSDLGIAVAGTSLTYTNLEQRNVRRLQVALLPWIIRIERAVSSLLAQPRYVKLNVDGLLRGDSAARWSTYEAASRINTAAAALGQPPVLETTEMREFEDMSPLPESSLPEPPAAVAVPQMQEVPA